MDPYYDVQADTINLIKQLRTTHHHEHQQKLVSEIKMQLDDLTEMITLISKNRIKFTISERELHSRKQFIKDVKSEIATYTNKSQLIDTNFESPHHKTLNTYQPLEFETPDDPVSIQTYIKSNLAEQDTYLDEIGRSLEVLKQINYQISDELTNQDAVIDDLSKLTEETEDHLRDGSKKIDQVMASKPSTSTQVVGIVALGATVMGLLTALLHL